MRLKAVIAACALLALPGCMTTSAPSVDYAAAVAAPGRTADHLALDEVRRPAEILQFMGLRPGDRALDFLTGSGYYAELMARVVGPQGRVVGWNTPAFMSRDAIRTSLDGIRARNANASFIASPVNALDFPPNSYDFVMMHLVYHDAYWESAQFNFPRIDPNTVTQAIFRTLRPGGTVAVIDHVANPGRDTRAEVEATHRILPETVRADFERAGFVLEAESPILRNMSEDRSVNVFNPAIRGRTDRIVYRFRKPRR
jgi:predicted methyltransferase